MRGWRQHARLSEGDRLSLSFFASLGLHAFVVFGIGFVWVAPDRNRTPPMLEVTLAQQPQQQAPEDHDFLAAANQEGGGQSQQANEPQQARPRSSTGNSEGEQSVTAAPPSSEAEPAERKRQLTGNQKRQTQTQEPSPETDTEAADAEVIDDQRQLASEQALKRAREAVDAKYPSKRYVRARTQSHDAANYMRQWVNRIEEIGNLNYPEEARQRNLAGRVTLEVTLRPDGSVREVKTLRASDYPALDQAAKRIVDLAAPFDAIPDDVLEGDDLLVITRTWEFDNGLDTEGALGKR